MTMLEMNINDSTGMNDIDVAYFNLQALSLAIDGLAHMDGEPGDPLLYSLRLLTDNIAKQLEPHVTTFCLECRNIFNPCTCKKAE